MVVYDDPSGNQVRLTVDEAIGRQKDYCLEKYDARYDSDAEALEDFCTIHWAWIVNH